MPAAKKMAPWEEVLRSQARALCKGWTVRESDHRVRIVVRPEGRLTESITLDFPWREDAAPDAYVRIRNIYQRWSTGLSLRESVGIASVSAPTARLDWEGAAARFKVQKMNHGAAIKQVTWDMSYSDTVAMAVGLMTGKKPPANSADLMDLCISDWAPGTRKRQMRAQALAQFLKHCVRREQFPDDWRAPEDLASHVGQKVAMHQKGSPITDDQILELLEGLPTNDAGKRWSDALMLMTELGLRPIELLHISVRLDPMTGDRYWWCAYEKRSGGGSTEPRRVYPLAPMDTNGEPVQWDLMRRWRGGQIELPPLESGNGCGDGLKTYLMRQKAWLQLRAELAQAGERLVPYSLRHSYSLRGHRLGIDAGSMARSMGHSYEVHCRSYPWASEANTAAAFAKVRKAA